MVAADGGRSPVHKALGIGFTGETRDEERMALGYRSGRLFLAGDAASARWGDHPASG
ncbi:hypothetical protein AB0K16_21720 [Nonomuraea jabiensis]|uniref:hypothetical protein n=1 Tax=Nonomuraea jabiensis TaxID=882448 RepID=UPI0034350087